MMAKSPSPWQRWAEKTQHHLRRLTFKMMDNQRRRFKAMDYITLTMPERLGMLPEPTNPIREKIFGKAPVSLVEMEQMLRRIALDPRAKGVILYIRPLQNTLADLQSLRQSLMHLREAGKRVVCFAHSFDLKTYYVASAATDIILQTGGDFAPTGTYANLVFLKDALESVGLQADFVAISPYKGAADTLTRNDISPEQREQYNWLLDSIFNTLVNDIAAARNLSPETVRTMIDNAPYTDEQALSAGFVDAVMTEEAMAAYLGAKHIITWEKAHRVLIEPWIEMGDKRVAVMRLGGMIVEGESRKPPADIPIPLLGAERMGNITVVQHIRHLMKDNKAAAVVVIIDSPGGSASASEAITAALQELARTRPVVVYMAGVAASGGYYIATPAHWIIAQPTTLTGSIGVLGGKIINSGLLRKLKLNAVEFLRGENAGINSASAIYNEAQRAKIRDSIERVYKQFLDHVATSRRSTPEAIDAVGGGRVWTGQQALDHGLVDALGGLREAIAKARELAKLPTDAPAVLFRSKNKPIVPQLAEQLNPTATFQYLHDGMTHAFDSKAQLLLPFVWDL